MAVTTISANNIDYHIAKIGDSSKISNLPFSIRVLLENVIRNNILDTKNLITQSHIDSLENWPAGAGKDDVPFMPGRVILQDFTGVPAVVDLAAMRSELERQGKDPKQINPLIPVDLVIDHSVQVDYFATKDALQKNTKIEFQRNKERYTLLRWAQKSFDNFRIVPPGTGIVHQVNLECLADVTLTAEKEGKIFAFPDTLVGTDSHTTMINALSVLGWGVGGIEAEAVMLGQPYYMILPEVVGVNIKGTMQPGTTATDLVLTVTEILRKKGVVGKFVEFFGQGLQSLSLPDRATLANMAPEYGATMGFFPIDDESIRFLRFTGREKQANLTEIYAKANNFFYDYTIDPTYSDTVNIDISSISPCVAGPSRPQDRVEVKNLPSSFKTTLSSHNKRFLLPENTTADYSDNKALTDGSVVIAAITSCTNTSNPSVLIGAGLLAKNAVEKGLSVESYVKTSLAPGSRVVTRYLEKAGLLSHLESLGFHLVGYGCTTCIGNSGPLANGVSEKILEDKMLVAAVLSGNRNFEARVHSDVRANYLASPMLVVAYALAGKVTINFDTDSLGNDKEGNPVFLKDIWPNSDDITTTINSALSPSLFIERYKDVFNGDTMWQEIDTGSGTVFNWEASSTYIQEAPFFVNLPKEISEPEDILHARVLALLGDSVTTDHISPAGAIAPHGPAGQYLQNSNVTPLNFNTYGSRRGNHDIMMRGTFANVRIKNQLLDGKEGGYTKSFITNEEMSIYDAAMLYKKENIPTIVIAGKEYGTGSSRDWAAKGTKLLGTKAVIAQSFERIHRSNLVGMGVLPLEFLPGENAHSLDLKGNEQFSIKGIYNNLTPRQKFEVVATSPDGNKIKFTVQSRLDSSVDVTYYKNGGILQTVLRSYL